MQSVKLGSIIHLEKGKKAIKLSSVAQNGWLPYVDIHTFETKAVANFTDGEKCLPCKNGEILIVCDGSRSGLVGKAIDGYVGSTLAKISAEGVIPEYLFYYLQEKYPKLNTQKKGTGTPHLNQALLKDEIINIPSVDEQFRTVAYIDEIFLELDKVVDTLKTTKEQLEVYRQAVLVDIFSQEHPLRQLKEISVALSGFAFKSKNYTPDGKYTVIKIGNVKDGYLDFSRDKTRTNEVTDRILQKYLLKQGDCLITLTGTRGKRDYGFVSMIERQTDYLLNQRVAALRFDTMIALPEFFRYYLSSLNYRNQFFKYETGNVGQGNVGIKALCEPAVPCPPLDTQKKIVGQISDRLSVCDSIEKTVDTALAQADAMRQSILKQAFEE